jgi:hypothetical protein
MACDHKGGHWQSGGTCDWTGEELPDVFIEESTTEDLDVGRFRCTQCGLVMYYTGLWKDFHESGTPCAGSEGVLRVIPQAQR